MNHQVIIDSEMPESAAPILLVLKDAIDDELLQRSGAAAAIVNVASGSFAVRDGGGWKCANITDRRWNAVGPWRLRFAPRNDSFDEALKTHSDLLGPVIRVWRAGQAGSSYQFHLPSRNGEEKTVGRSSSNDVPIEDEQVSRVKHVRFYYQDGIYYVEDRNSSGGSFINERQISGSVAISHGAKIRIGSTTLEFFDPMRALEALPKEEPAPARPAAPGAKIKINEGGAGAHINKAAPPESGAQSRERFPIFVILLAVLAVAAGIAVVLILYFNNK